ncbi:MAG: carboxylating nicotinate-nucleotide diphosphorylase [Chthonomonadaceae bacterium]|nr:carboxylating nicotinate-nucleotide diphosphorylase [Chthonomonadaceae bacterium]
MNLSLIAEIVTYALREDLGAGDITTLSTVPKEAKASATMIAKTEGVIAGLPVVEEVYRQVDPSVKITRRVEEGAHVPPRTVLCEIVGDARSLLTGERVALNFLQRLSGIATKTARFVSLVEGSGVRVVDTRKTTPGLRPLERYAVKVGGGHNHRYALDSAVMIKDNHIAASGGITAAVERARKAIPHTMTITVECDTLAQVSEAVAAKADILLLDNMTLDQLREAVSMIGGRAKAEASGGVNELTISEIARTGVDLISVGALTHSAIALDIGLDLVLVG